MAESVSDLIKQATEAVKNVPENLQEIAFSKAFDALMAGGDSEVRSPRGTSMKKRKGSKEKAEETIRPDRSQLDELDRTQYPAITADSTALANSLRVLLAARDDLDIDGLSASDIAHTLVDKFRCKVTRQAISQCLNSAGQLVNRHKEGNAVIFRIMGRGETYLDQLAASDDENGATAHATGTNRTKRAKTAGGGKKRTKVGLKRKVPVKKKATKSKAGKGPGAKAALTQLYEGGFFKSPQTIGSIIEHLKHSLGRTYKPNHMSPALLRYLRSQKLKRTQNEDNQYEYENA